MHAPWVNKNLKAPQSVFPRQFLVPGSSFLASCLLTLAGLLWVPNQVLAQPERFELGQRLRAFEADFEQFPDPICRKRAAPSLKQTVWIPFSLQPGLAAQKLDQARYALRSAEAQPSERVWAESLWLSPACRFVDLSLPELGLSLKPFYAVDAEVPKEARLRLTLCNQAGKALVPTCEAGIAAVPMQARLPLAGVVEGDHTLKVQILVAGQVIVSRQLTVSCVSNQTQRLGALQKAVEIFPATPTSSERESIRYLAQVLGRLANQETLETNYPAHRLLAETESALKALAGNQTYFGARRPGDFWLNLTVEGRAVPVRMLVPTAAAKGDIPLVVALHGASGSENLFFEGYGRGAIVKLCQERGWLLVAPRLSAFSGAYPIPELVDEVARLYPVSRKHIFLVGHSMGAAQAVLNTSKTPERFAAVAALAGGGLVQGSDHFKTVPFFVGVGTDDFALSWARNLHQGLRNAGVEKLAFREYPNVEHLSIAQVALGDVFRWLDEIAKAK